MAKGDLNSRQIQFVQNLLTGMTYTDAYKEAGYKPKNDDIAASSASHLLKDVPKVREYWESQKDEMMELARSRCVSLAMEALPVLQDLLTDKDPQVQLAAIRQIIKLSGLEPDPKLKIESEAKTYVLFPGLDDDDLPDPYDPE